MPTTNLPVVVKIGDVDHTAGVRAETLAVRATLGQVGSSEFVMDSLVHAVAIFDRVEILINGSVVWGGYVVEMVSVLHDAGDAVDLAWRVQCQDYSILLDRTLVNDSFASAHPTTTLTAITAGVVSTDGFTLSSQLAAELASKPFTFEAVTLRSAINTVCAAYEAYWYVTPGKVITIYPANSYAISSYGIDTGGANGANSAVPLRKSLRVERTTTGLINSVTVNGGRIVTDVEHTQTHNGPDDGGFLVPLYLANGEFVLDPVPLTITVLR